MKKTFLLIIVFLSLLYLGSCDENSQSKGEFKGSKIVLEDKFDLEYSILDRAESAELSLEEGDTLKVEFNNTSGYIDIVITDPNRKKIYRGNNQVNAEFEISITETGIYTIKVIGNKAVGKATFFKITSNE